jgi:signal transduction histidine kinase
VNQWLAALYRRDRERYPRLIVAVLVAGTAAINVLWGVLAARTYGIPPEDAVLPIAGAALVTLPAAVLIAWVIRADGRVLLAWVAGLTPRDQAAPRSVLGVVLRLPWRTFRTALGVGLIVMDPVILAVFALAGWDLDGQDLLLFAGGGSLGVTYAAGFAFCTLEMALRPIRVELGATIERDDAGRLGYFSLKSKVLLGLVITAIVMGFAIGVLIAEPDSSFLEGLRIVMIAVVAGGLVGGSLALPFSIAALTPIDDLVAGTREVAAGNLAARVPVTSTDEFADLVVSFNEMVEGLREREALRGHNAELVEELQASRARIVAASNEARRQVERDLHDGAQQNLVLLNLKLGQVERAVADDPAARSLVVDTRAELERALAELRDLAHGIYPQVLTSDGLSAALAEAAAGAPVLTDLDSDGTGRYPAELEAAVYFCCLEALQNAAKHAGEGTRATIRLSEQDGTLRFEVADNGCGFDVVSTNGSAGLQNMADRIGALGGELQVTSTLGHGTRVTGRVPVETVPGGGT